jgi:hypothetical protein
LLPPGSHEAALKRVAAVLAASDEQQAATIAELREHLREAEHYVRAWTQEHGETGTLAQARGNALLDNIRATLERTRGQ